MRNEQATAHISVEAAPLEAARREIETLREALATRTTIGQAIGMLMIQRNSTSEAAFDHLVELSSHTNLKLRDIAKTMVEKANERAVAKA